VLEHVSYIANNKLIGSQPGEAYDQQASTHWWNRWANSRACENIFPDLRGTHLTYGAEVNP
jgi:hypothetical protein